MIFKNSVKVLLSNFNIVWKLILYFLIVTLFIVSALYFLLYPIVEMIVGAGFVQVFVELYYEFMSTLNLAGFFEGVSIAFESVVTFILDNIYQLWPYLIGIALVIFFFYFFMFNLSNYAICNSINYYMGSLTRQGFFTSFKESFGVNFKTQICYYFITLQLLQEFLIFYVFILITQHSVC